MAVNEKAKVLLSQHEHDEFDKEKKELEKRSENLRKEMAKVLEFHKDISTIQALNDLKEEKYRVDCRLKEVEKYLKLDIEENPFIDKAGLCTAVTILHCDTEEIQVVIIGNEANYTNGIFTITKESPVGKAICGHKVNDVCAVSLPHDKMEKVIITKIESVSGYLKRKEEEEIAAQEKAPDMQKVR